MLPDETQPTKKPTRRSRRKPRKALTPAIVPASPPESPTRVVSSLSSPEQLVPETAAEPLPQRQQVPKPIESREQQVSEAETFRAWKLIPIDLPPTERTRPTRVLLTPHDPRIWRRTHPREDPLSLPPLLSPIRRTPPRPNVSRGNQTDELQQRYRATQHTSSYRDTDGPVGHDVRGRGTIHLARRREVGTHPSDTHETPHCVS